MKACIEQIISLRALRILGVKEHNISSVSMSVLTKHIKQAVRSVMEDRRRAIREEEGIYTDFCENIAKAVTRV